MNTLKRIAGISDTAAVMCFVIVTLFFVMLAGGVAVIGLVFRFEEPMPFAIGLAAGCLLSIAKVILLERSLDRSLDMPEEKSAKNYTHLHAILRYFLTAIVMISAVLMPQAVGLFGMIIGILTLQISAYITGAIVKKKNIV